MNRVGLLIAANVAPLASVALAVPAHGATVTATQTGCESPPCATDLTVESRGPERNALSFAVRGTAVVVRDGASPLRARRGCTRRSDGAVQCAFRRPLDQLVVNTGGGDDVVRTPGWNAAVWLRLEEGDDRFVGGGRVKEADGGPGDDTLMALGARRAVLEGGAGDDGLVTGRGDDRLVGGPGRDRMAAGAGDDVLSAVDVDDPFEDPVVPAPDSVDGGPGRDRVGYGGAQAGVVVDLREPSAAGQAGEGDTLSRVEDVGGGNGPDRLSGDDGPNLLMGGDGLDVLDGRGGDDQLRAGVFDDEAAPDAAEQLAGGDGADVMFSRLSGAFDGGAGDDVISTGLRRRGSSAACGPGREVVRVPRGTTPAIDASCEGWAARVAPLGGGERTVFPFPRVVDGAIGLTVPCEDTPRPGHCFLTLELTTPEGERLAISSARVPTGEQRLLAGRLPDPAPPRVRVVVSTRRLSSGASAGVVVATGT